MNKHKKSGGDIYQHCLPLCAISPSSVLVKYGGHQDQLSRKHWGMDRFRIQALKKMLKSNVLTPEKYESTLSMLTRKIQILLAGATKHHNTALIGECRQIITQYNLQLPDQQL